MCERTVLRFQVRLRERFSNSFYLKMMKWCSRADLSSAWDALARRLLKSVLKQDLFHIKITYVFWSQYNFADTYVMRLIFSFKMFKILCRIHKGSESLT